MATARNWLPSTMRMARFDGVELVPIDGLIVAPEMGGALAKCN